MEFIPSLIKFFVNFWTDYVAAFVIDFFLGAL